MVIKNLVTIWKYFKYRVIRAIFNDPFVVMLDDVKEPEEFEVARIVFGEEGDRTYVIIYCKIRHFQLNYKGWLSLKKKATTYSVRGECTDNAGTKLKDIMATVVSVPDLGFDAGSDNITLDNAVQAYLRILEDMLGKQSRTIH